jgi:hypothetical protein
MIVAAAIIDRTIGWMIISVTFGLALHGDADLFGLRKSLAGILVTETRPPRERLK